MCKFQAAPAYDMEAEVILDFLIFSLGILGLVILNTVLARLSARMGEGMGLPGYYWLYYITVLTLAIALAAGWTIYYTENESSQEVLFSLLIMGNVISTAASFRYWWWLRNELINKNKGEKSNG
jgi:hypothetical protein